MASTSAYTRAGRRRIFRNGGIRVSMTCWAVAGDHAATATTESNKREWIFFGTVVPRGKASRNPACARFEIKTELNCSAPRANTVIDSVILGSPRIVPSVRLTFWNSVGIHERLYLCSFSGPPQNRRSHAITRGGHRGLTHIEIR